MSHKPSRTQQPPSDSLAPQAMQQPGSVPAIPPGHCLLIPAVLAQPPQLWTGPTWPKQRTTAAV